MLHCNMARRALLELGLAGQTRHDEVRGDREMRGKAWLGMADETRLGGAWWGAANYGGIW